MSQGSFTGGMTRRQFLKTALAAGAILSFPGNALSRPAPPERERSLAFYNLHTGERVKSTYWADGRYLFPALQEISHFMRDFRTGEIKSIDPRLLDLLYQVGLHLDTREQIHLISGYRSPETNAMLRRHSRGVALHSLHLDGRAADIRIPGHSLETLRKVALFLKGGGVGYYPHLDFVHMDTGRIRQWWGS